MDIAEGLAALGDSYRQLARAGDSATQSMTGLRFELARHAATRIRQLSKLQRRRYWALRQKGAYIDRAIHAAASVKD